MHAHIMHSVYEQSRDLSPILLIDSCRDQRSFHNSATMIANAFPGYVIAYSNLSRTYFKSVLSIFIIVNWFELSRQSQMLRGNLLTRCVRRSVNRVENRTVEKIIICS